MTKLLSCIKNICKSIKTYFINLYILYLRPLYTKPINLPSYKKNEAKKAYKYEGINGLYKYEKTHYKQIHTVCGISPSKTLELSIRELTERKNIIDEVEEEKLLEQTMIISSYKYLPDYPELDIKLSATARVGLAEYLTRLKLEQPELTVEDFLKAMKKLTIKTNTTKSKKK